MKKLKNSLPLLLILSLIITAMVNLNPAYASPTALSVIFPNGTTISIDEYDSGATFTVKINVTDIIGLFGFDFTLKYDTAVLTATSVNIGAFLLPGYIEFKKEINDAAGYVWYGVTQFFYESGVDGSGTLATITFTVDSSGASILDLDDTKLSDSAGEVISHEVIDGSFSNIGVYPIVLFTHDPETPAVHEKVEFDASFSFSASPIVSYEWDFGDGEYDSGVITSHAYGTPGTYTVTLTVTDSESNVGSASRDIEVVLPTYKADLVRKSAWPEHHRFSISGDEDGYQTLYGKAMNSKYATDSAIVKVAFTITQEGIEVPGSPFETAEVTLAPGDITLPDLTCDLDASGLSGKYYVSARCFYRDGTEWVAGAKKKSFSFVVIP